MGTWGWQGGDPTLSPPLQGLLLRQLHHLPAVRPAEPAEAILVPGLQHGGRALRGVWPHYGVSGPRLPLTHLRALGWTQSTQWCFGDWGGPGNAHGNGSAAGRESLLDPGHSGEHGEPRGRGQDWGTGIRLNPTAAPAVPAWSRGAARAGAALSWGHSCARRAQPWHRDGTESLPHTTLDSAPSPAHGTGVTGAEPQGECCGIFPGLDRVRCGASLSPRCFL